MKTKATKCFLIGRTSKERPEDQRHRYSIDVQLSSVEKWAKENKLEVVGNYPIKNETGFAKSRKKFNEMLTQAKEKQEEIGEPLALVFTEVDRLGRNVFSKEVFELVELTRDEGRFEIHFSEDEDFLTKDSSPKEWSTFTEDLNRAWNESAKKSRKIKKGLKKKREEGYFLGWACTGYQNIATVNKQGEIEKSIILDKERAEIIKMIFEKYAHEDLNGEQLARIATAKGFTMKPKRKNQKPKPPNRNNILDILKNEKYIGCFKRVNEDGEVELVKAKNLEPIVSEELFEKANKKINDTVLRMKLGKKHSTTKFFKYRQMVKCGYCGCYLTPDDFASKYKGRKKPNELKVFYRCSYAKRNVDVDWYMKKFGTKNCPQESWDEREIEAEIKETLGMMTYDKKKMEELRLMLNQEYKKTIKFNEGQKKILQRKIKEKEGLKDKLVDSLAMEELIDVKLDIQERIKAVRLELEKLNKQLSQIAEDKEMNTDEFMDTITLCSDLEKQYEQLPPARKRELCMIAFESIEAMKGYKTIKGKKRRIEALDVRWNEPFLSMLESGLLKIDYKPPKIGGGNVLKTKNIIRDMYKVMKKNGTKEKLEKVLK